MWFLFNSGEKDFFFTKKQGNFLENLATNPVPMSLCMSFIENGYGHMEIENKNNVNVKLAKQ